METAFFLEVMNNLRIVLLCWKKQIEEHWQKWQDGKEQDTESREVLGWYPRPIEAQQGHIL